MFFQRINRTDPEKIFVVCKNAYSSAALVAGNVVCWAYNGTDDGLAVTRPSTALKKGLTAGVIAEGIAIGGYGQLQVFGNNADTLVAPTLATPIAVGEKLQAVDAVFTLVKAAGTVVDGESGLIVAGAANISDTSVARVRKSFVRCL